MSLRNLLETFDVLEAPSAKNADTPSQASLESVRASAFEAGYASGWEDAKTADDQARSRVQAEFERNVEGISFTYHEAIDLIRGELKGFIDALLSEFLPEILPDALRAHVRAQLLSAAEEQIDLPVEIVVSQNCSALVSELSEGDFELGLKVVEDASLADNQVFVRIEKREKEINLAPLISELKFQLSAIGSNREDALKNG